MQELRNENGVRITRRTTLGGVLALPALGGLRRWSRLPDHEETATEDLDRLLESWAERSQALVAAEAPNEDAHLFELCAALTAIAPESFPKRTRTVFEDGGTSSGPIFGAPSFFVIEFELDPGAVIPAHNHVGHAFLSLGVEGEVRVRHFVPEREAPEPDVLDREFLVREVASTLLLPGRTSTLTRARANIHQFQAGEEGARFLDFGVSFSEPGPGPSIFSVLDIAEAPTDAMARRYPARWLGNIYAKK